MTDMHSQQSISNCSLNTYKTTKSNKTVLKNQTIPNSESQSFQISDILTLPKSDSNYNRGAQIVTDQKLNNSALNLLSPKQ